MCWHNFYLNSRSRFWCSDTLVEALILSSLVVHAAEVAVSADVKVVEVNAAADPRTTHVQS